MILPSIRRSAQILRSTKFLKDCKTGLFFEARRLWQTDGTPLAGLAKLMPPGRCWFAASSVFLLVQPHYHSQNSTLSKDHIVTKISCLRPILRKWTSLNGELAKLWSKAGDVPWWYNERAVISVFAGAVWQSGGYAFEEYAALKHGKRQEYKGRVDLDFVTAAGHKFRAEVKPYELPATRRKDPLEQVCAAMDRAVEDVCKCQSEGRRRLAMVFASPYVSTKKSEKIPDTIDWLIAQAKRVHATLKTDAVAWTFPDLKQRAEFGEWICPGAIIWIREIKRCH